MKLKIVFTLLTAFVVQLSFAQQKTISGTVTDQDGVSLPGASIVVKGTGRGAQTDFDGNYTLEASVGEILVFSYIGQKTTEQTVGTSNVLNVQLQEDATLLDEVVVVAYGKQKKRAILGSVASIGKDVIEKQQSASVVTALQGRVPGLLMSNVGGQPGDNPKIRVRGIGTISSLADPLIVVDGAPFNGDINTLSADQVESINVLKEAASTALYGSRGANGVILINAKKGKPDTAPEIRFSSSVGFASRAVKPHELIDTDTYVVLAWEALRNSFLDSGSGPGFAASIASSGLIEDLGYNPYGIPRPVNTDGQLVATNKLWDTDWEELLFRKAALRTEQRFSVSGGSDNTTYFLSAAYLTQEGNVKTSFFDRLATRLNVKTRLSHWFSIGVNTMYSTSEQNYPVQAGDTYRNPMKWVYTVPSLFPLYRRDETGQLILDASGNPVYDYGDNPEQPVNGYREREFSFLKSPSYNAVADLYNSENLNTRENVTLNTYAKLNLGAGLSFKTQLAYERYLLDSYAYESPRENSASGLGGSISQSRALTTTTNLVNALKYARDLGDHAVAADLIQEAYKAKNDRISASATDLPANVKVLDGSTTPESIGGSVSEERLLSYLGRLSYNFKERYYVETSYRTDGATQFAKDVRWENFFSLAAAWIVSEEHFLARNETLSFLKLKASYGKLGNNRGLGYFPYLQGFEPGWNHGNHTGIILGTIKDSGIRWEQTKTVNLGMELGLLQNRLNIAVEYYYKRSYNLIYNRELPPSTGDDRVLTNLGTVRNYGLEVSLNGVNFRTTDMEWTTGLNFSLDNNKVLELASDIPFISNLRRPQVGRSLYEFYLKEYAGVDPATGDALYYTDVPDAEGQPTGARETTTGGSTQYYTGKSTLPKLSGGFSQYLRLRNFDMNLLFNFSLGAYVYDESYARLMTNFTNGNRNHNILLGSNFISPMQVSADLADRWQQPGDITDVPRLRVSASYLTPSTRFLFKNNYLRLKSLNLGYNLPQDAISEFGLSMLRLYLQGDNVLTFQSHKGIDPEQDFDLAATNFTSHNQLSFIFGVEVQF